MPSLYELGVYINPAAEPISDKIAALLKQDYVHSDSIPLRVRSVALPRRVVIRGGERSNRTLIQEVYNRNLVVPVGITGGGTNNVLYHALLEQKRAMSIEQFLDTDPERFPQHTIFHPGQVGVEVFNNQAGFGNYEQWSGRLNESFRSAPKKVRAVGAKLAAYVPGVIQHGDTIDMYSISPNIGAVEAFPDQRLFGNAITHAWIEGNKPQQSAKLAATLFLWTLGKRPPESILHIQRGDIFTTTKNSNTLWLDGDTESTKLAETTQIQRAAVGIPVVALV